MTTLDPELTMMHQDAGVLQCCIVLMEVGKIIRLSVILLDCKS